MLLHVGHHIELELDLDQRSTPCCVDIALDLDPGQHHVAIDLDPWSTPCHGQHHAQPRIAVDTISRSTSRST